MSTVLDRAIPQVSIQLLGRFAVHRGDQELPLRPFGGRLARRLLRMLALSRGTLLSKEVAAEALWPTRPPADTPGNVEILVSRIRRALGDRSLVETGPAGYSLVGDERCWVDVEAFLTGVVRGEAELAHHPIAALAAFRGALALWHGEPLAEDAYADWAAEHRRHLWRARLEALEGATTAALATGDPTSAVDWAQAATEQQPLREASAMLLAHAQAAGGDRAAALTTFDTFGRRLADELGVDPSAEAMDLRQRILRDRIRPDHVAAGARPEAGAGLPHLPLLDRDDALLQITASTSGAGPRALLVRGPPGIGKSRLLTEAAAQAEVPAIMVRVIRAHRYDAWAVARELVRAATDADVDEGDRRAVTVPMATRVIESLARPRCLLVVDDLQWADERSLTLLRMLLRRVPGLILLAAYRPEDASAGVTLMQALSGADPALLRSVLLRPLSATTLGGLFADPRLGALVVDHTHGHPAAVAETLAVLGRGGLVDANEQGRWRLRRPADIHRARILAAATARSVTRERIATLPPRHRELLALVTLLDRHAPASVLALATGRDLRGTLDVLDALVEAGMVDGCTDGWTVATGTIGGAVLDTLGWTEQARLHLLLAQALQQQEADGAEIATHLAAGGDQQAAATAFATAAHARLDQIADEDALHLADAGLSLSAQGAVKAALLEVRGEVHRRRGRLPQARTDLETALAHRSTGPDRSRILAQLAILETRSRDVIGGGELVELAIAEAGDDPAARGQALAAGAITDLTLPRLGRARRRFHEARHLLDQAGDTNGAARLLYWRGMARFVAGRPAEAARELDPLAHLAAVPTEVLRLWHPRVIRGHALVFMAEPAAGLAEIEEVLAWARAVEHPVVHSACLWHRGEALAALGRHADAVDSAEAAVAIARRVGHAEEVAASLRGLGVAWHATGDLERAEQAFRGSLRTAQNAPLFAGWAAARLGLVLVEQGRFAEAAPLIDTARHHGMPLIRHEARWAHAELLRARGEHTASRFATTALNAARTSGYLVLVPRLAALAES
ncbi:BTAD domain-containing putative transcriptional regulator [Pseudonocardia sp. 73-21]|uniref:AfsR/SARP family transcriptional regulator n=2 Tax=Pseudonocardia TaxID=1847 RepID=UPI00261259DC|nr:BTAD domain-containing putative transcriptional regulator [Pseudonocardia sp. 73-21]